MEHSRLQAHTLSFDTKRMTQVIGLMTASLACLAAALVYSHPIPEDTALKITSIQQLLTFLRQNLPFMITGRNIQFMYLQVPLQMRWKQLELSLASSTNSASITMHRSAPE